MTSGPWIMVQSWRALLFAHWRVPAERMRELVPGGLTVEEFDGSAWVALTPFRLTGLRPRGLPAIPRLSDFLEMNLRTYVRVGDRPGIWFFSLDASSQLAVAAARAFYRLPYHLAQMRMTHEDGWIRYESRRADESGARFSGRYRPTGPTFSAAPGTLEHFLTERYALYVALRNGKVLRGDIQHPPWVLRTAEGELDGSAMTSAHGITLPGDEPILHFSERQDTLIAPLRFAS